MAKKKTKRTSGRIVGAPAMKVVKGLTITIDKGSSTLRLTAGGHSLWVDRRAFNQAVRWYIGAE